MARGERKLRRARFGVQAGLGLLAIGCGGGGQVRSFRGGVKTVAIAPDGKKVLTGGRGE